MSRSLATVHLRDRKAVAFHEAGRQAMSLPDLDHGVASLLGAEPGYVAFENQIQKRRREQ